MALRRSTRYALLKGIIMHLRHIVKRTATGLHVIAALVGFAVGSTLASAAYAALSGDGRAPVSPSEHAAVLQSFTVGVGVIILGVSQAAHALRSWASR